MEINAGSDPSKLMTITKAFKFLNLNGILAEHPLKGQYYSITKEQIYVDLLL